MNLLRYFESQEIKDARRLTDDLKRLVEMAKGEQREAENRLRQSIGKAKDLTRMPIADSLVWRGRDNV